MYIYFQLKNSVGSYLDYLKKINMRIFKLNVYAFFEQLTVRVISVPK